MLLSSEIVSSQGVFAFPIAGAMLLLPYGLGAGSPAGVEEHVQTDIGFSRNLGDPVVSSADSRLELPGYQLQASAAHSSAGERTQRVQPRYRQTKETKCGGMGDRKS